MSASAKHRDLPFDEAIQFFKDKVKLPTATWKALWQGMHARAFVSAGAMKDQLLTDLHSAVLKGLEKGTTLKEFRDDFSDIVQKHGWQYKGGKGWRSAVIFNTNIATAYDAGHYKQMTDPDVLKARPYWRYVASSAADPRPEHMAWYNVILPADHPWWDTHTPRNGWGCKCGVVSHSAREVERLKKEEADGPNPIKATAPKTEHYEWTDKATGKVHSIPKGIDPGWDYNVGKAAWGKQLSEKTMATWQAQGAKAWERLTPGDWRSAGRSEKIAIDKPAAKVGPPLKSQADLAAALKKVLGAEERVFSFQQNKFRYNVLANAATLAEHVPLDRTPFVPFIPEALADPFEVWLSFERHKGTGKYELRQRIIKAVSLEKDRAVLMVAQSRGGVMEAWTMIPTTNLDYVNNQRQGKLIWSR
ncbi:MAG: phage minor head protein [Desulfobacterales bacterium]|nr:phage minor head protein [Desulfobacterales bacterium]